VKLFGAIIAFVPMLWAGPGSYPGFDRVGSAPVQAVCTVEQVVRLGAVPDSLRRSAGRERYFEAKALVLRVLPQHPFEPGDRIRIRYVSSEEPLVGSGGGSMLPPVILKFAKGDTDLFPLERNGRFWDLQTSDNWRIAVPALAAAPAFGPPPRTAREFVFRELVNTLAHAAPPQRVRAAEWLSRFSGDVPPELPRYLHAALGRDDNAWLATGCAFLGVFGAPQEDRAALTYGESSPPFHRVRDMVTWILWKGDRRDYPDRLIRRLVRDAYTSPWPIANALIQYKDSTVLIDELNRAMRRDVPGTITIAYKIVEAGQHGVLPGALDVAQRRIDRVAAGSELPFAARLIIEFGDNQQFETLAATLARFRRENETAYRDLWGASYTANRRILRLAEVLIDDRRPISGEIRYCDMAAAVVASYSGERPKLPRNPSLTERDKVVARAASWLAVHRGTF
jgi:hypothetical protein